MRKYGTDTTLRCIITTSPETPPVAYRNLSRRPTIQTTTERAFQEFVKSGGDIERYYTGRERIDLQLDARNISGDDYKFLKELERRRVPAYIYSSVPGSVQHHIPLINGVGGDPSDGTYTATVATGTTVYFPRGDASHVAYLEETDFVNNVILADGIQNHSGLLSTLSNELPLGRGAAILSTAKNWLKNSGFADDGTDIYNWTWSGGSDGVDLKEENGWLGVPSLTIWGTTDTWTSDTFDCSTLVTDYVAISFGWMTDGELLVEWNDGSGGGWGELVTLDKGSGYYSTTVQVPALGANFQLRFSNPTGYLGRFTAPQIVGSSGVDRKRYYAYVEGLGEDVQGEITACSLKYTGHYEASMWVTSPTDDSALIVSGYVLPLRAGAQMAQTQKLFSLYNSLTDKELECHMNKGAATTTLFLRSNSTDICNVEITGHALGEVIYIAMIIGWSAGTATHGIYARVVGEDTTYSATGTTGANFYTSYDELFIGTDHDGNYGADALFSTVDVWAGTYTPCCAVTNTLIYMTDEDNLTEHRMTLGRRYYITADLSPSPWNRERYSGTIYCRQEKNI